MTINLPHILFYLFSAVAVLAAAGVVTVRNSVFSVLYLVLTFVSTAGVWMLLETEFLALILVLVYVGAVMTLFLFVVMMLNLRTLDLRQGLVRAWPLVLILLLMLVAIMVMATHVGEGSLVLGQPFQPLTADYSNVTALGSVLYTIYVWPFEIAAVLLLTAIVAAIALSHRKTAAGTLKQNISQQVNARPRERVRLVNIPSAKKGGAV